MYGWESGPESTDLYCNATERGNQYISHQLLSSLGPGPCVYVRTRSGNKTEKLLTIHMLNSEEV